MKHLSPSELVDFAEGTLTPARAAHAETCEACGAAAGNLRETLARAAGASPDVPEPSPLFWDHLSARVRDGIASETPAARGSSWHGLRALAPLAALGIVVAVLSVTMKPRDAAVPVREATTAGAVADHELEPMIDANSSEAWDVLTAAAADLEWDEAHEAGMSVPPAAVDRAVQRLSAAEMNELGRLLQSELRRGSGD
jgi:hypothetical protein